MAREAWLQGWRVWWACPAAGSGNSGSRTTCPPPAPTPLVAPPGQNCISSLYSSSRPRFSSLSIQTRSALHFISFSNMIRVTNEKKTIFYLTRYRAELHASTAVVGENTRNCLVEMFSAETTPSGFYRVYKLVGGEAGVATQLHCRLLVPKYLLENFLGLLTYRTRQNFRLEPLALNNEIQSFRTSFYAFHTVVDMLVFLQTFLVTEILERPFVSDRSEEALTAADILLAITTHLEPFLVILQTDVGAELLNFAAEPDAVLAQTSRAHLLPAGAATAHSRLSIR